MDPFRIDKRPERPEDLKTCAAILPDGSHCKRKAEFLPRIVGWAPDQPIWTPDNAIMITLELPVCARCKAQYSTLDAYVTPRNWQIVCDYRRLAKKPVPAAQTLQLEFVPIDHLEKIRALHRH